MDWNQLADALEKHPKQVLDKKDWVNLLRELAKENDGDPESTEEE